MAVAMAAAAAAAAAAPFACPQVEPCDRGLAPPSSARHLATACRCHDETNGISPGFSRVDTDAPALGSGCARETLRARRGDTRALETLATTFSDADLF